jgi:hypothetical protein
MVKCPYCKTNLRFDPIKGWVHAESEDHGQRTARRCPAPRHRLTGQRWITKSEQHGHREAPPTTEAGW